MKVYLDTNVVVSALATRGLCADLFQLVLAEHELVVGETVLAELRGSLTKKLRLPSATIDALETFLRRQATVVSAGPPTPSPGLDSADAAVLAEAASGGVDVLVTGDQAFQAHPNPAVPVISPREFWDQLRRVT